MAKMLTRCPVCEAVLGVSELTCGRCQTRIHGAFDPCRFCRLAPEHLAFVETFLRCEGNLSKVEKELRLSYPTLRNKLTAALAALGFGSEMPAEMPATPEPRPDSAHHRREVLEALARGDISAEAAADALRDLT
jgi:hypothetical protein